MVKEITIIIDNLVSLYSVEPILREILTRGVTVHVACPKNVAKSIEALFPNLTGKLQLLENIRFQFARMDQIYRIVRFFVTPSNYSRQYRRLVHRRRDARYGLVRPVLAKVTLNWPHHKINRRLKFLFSRFVQNSFSSRRILALSMGSTPCMLWANDQEVMTMVESWDHADKFPIGYPSEKVFVWNRELGEDWTAYQGDTDILIGYPMKLRYALSETQKPSLRRPPGAKPCALYAAGTSSFTQIKEWYREEMRIIREVCRATKRVEWNLLIKPKPNNRKGDWDCLAEEFDHVQIGTYQDSPDGSHYYLDDDYNRRRFEELRSSDLVINSGTTFALEAAILGLPVLQLDFRNSSSYPAFAEACTSYHLQRYLLRDSDLTYSPPVDRSLSEGLAVYLASGDDRAQRFSEKLRRWITPSLRLEDTVVDMVDAILADY